MQHFQEYLNMSTLTALSDDKDLLSDVPEEIKGDLEWLLNLPEEPFKDCRDILALYEGAEFEETYSTGGKTNYYRDMVWSKWLM